jgi:hypothetical protein
MSRIQKDKSVFIPLTFNGFPARFILKITEFAQKSLLQQDPTGNFPIPFINKNDVGSFATFKSKEMADKVTELVDQVISHDFPEYCNIRVIMNLFYHNISEQDEKNFVFHIDDKTIILYHPDKEVAETTISKMTEMLEKYMIEHPTLLVADLLNSCSVKLTSEEILMISCGMKTFLMPIYEKEAQFMKSFKKTLERVKTQKIAFVGLDFYEVKKICIEISNEIDKKGVYFYITPENVELTGLQFNVKNFSESLKLSLKDHQSTDSRVLSRK